MNAFARQSSLKILLTCRPGAVGLCRDVEAVIHAVSTSEEEYRDLTSRACYNMHANKKIDDAYLIVHESDHVLARNTNLETIENEATARKERFHNMLHEKYEALNDESYEALVKCRKCGSSEIAWEEKQTRSADEAATLFCVCSKCKNRWIMS